MPRLSRIGLVGCVGHLFRGFRANFGRKEAGNTLRLIFARVIQGVFVLLILSLVLFGLRLVLGNPIETLLPPGATPAEVAATTHFYGLDKPLYIQYLIWLSYAVRGDMGNSLTTGEPAMLTFLERLPASALLSASSMLLSLGVAIPLGVLAAIKRDTVADIAVRAFAALAQAVPLFFVGLIAISLFSVTLGVLPVSGFDSPLSLVLPSISLAGFSIGAVIRLTRSSMLDVLDRDYIQVARSKGLPEWLVIVKHALRNALLPVASFASLFFAINIGFVVVIEEVFAWPGVGSLALNAARSRDYPVLESCVLMLTLIVMVVNLLADLGYGVLDPRVRMKR